jgi:hypothetical protein
MTPSQPHQRPSEETAAPAQHTASIPAMQSFVFDAAMDTIVAVPRQAAPKQQQG